MSVVIKKVETRKELRRFVRFPEKLYRDNPYYVPPLEFDQIDTLDQKKGAAQEFCDSELYLAYKNGELVGRVAAIVNHKANKQWNHKEVRFGWIDFVDDREVSKALIDKVEEFGRKHGMDSIVGPLGFTDFDPEGMMVEGFEHQSTMALRHAMPYYKTHMEAMGFVKEVDWVEFKIFMPEKMPDKVERVAKLVEERYKLHMRKVNKREVRKLGIGYKIFDLVNESYSKLYNFTILPKKVVDSYISFYLGILNLDFLTLVEDENNNIVGFGLCMPSITRAIQKCKGRMFPFGWFHILRSMYFKFEENVELLLIAVTPEYRKRGVNALIFADIIKRASAAGFKYAETNAELETNLDMQSQWGDFEKEQTKRRRIYKKSI